MIDLSMENLQSSDVDQLFGLTLCVAYAIHVEGWSWFKFPEDNLPHLLLDEPLPAGKRPNKDCARYIGDQYYVFKELPRYNEHLVRMYNKGQCIIRTGYGWNFSCQIEEEIKSSNHVRLLHVPPDKRCRAILKLFLNHPGIKADVNKETVNKETVNEE